MRNRSVFKSFRFEVVLYSILSLLYTIATEAVIYCFYYYAKLFVEGFWQAKQNDLPIGDALEQVWNMPIQNSTSFLDGTSATGLSHSLTSVLTVNKDYLVITLIIASILGMILFVIYFLLLTRQFSNYLYEITDGIRGIAGGNFNERIKVRNEDEFAIIASSVNKMAADIYEMMENERKSEQLKHELITNVAHDLRTPLTSIIGYLDLASNTDMDISDRNHYLDIACAKSKRLQRMIEDLFSYTKFSSGEVKVNKAELDLIKLVEQMIEEFYPTFQDEDMVCEFDCKLHKVKIYIDGDLIARAIGNLISNAIKYGSSGEKLTVRLEKDDKNVYLSVINYGSPIPEEDIPYLFDKFFRVEASRSVDTGGTGLGLAITKKIVQLHNGEIRVESNQEKTEFTITLPLEQE